MAFFAVGMTPIAGLARGRYVGAVQTQFIMILRHGEKTADPAPHQAVDEHGNHDEHSLTVKGWQRAGALALLYAEPALLRRRGLAQPRQLYACAVSPDHPSKRCEQTVAPLAMRLGVAPHIGYTKGDEEALARAIVMAGVDALVCWEHKALPALAQALAPGKPVPPRWPDARYDLIWCVRRDLGKAGPRVTFRQVPQNLLGGDLLTGIDGAQFHAGAGVG